jgi:hypothetical protein
MVQVRSDHRVVHALQDIEQAQAVWAAGNTQQNRLAPVQPAPVLQK